MRLKQEPQYHDLQYIGNGNRRNSSTGYNGYDYRCRKCGKEMNEAWLSRCDDGGCPGRADSKEENHGN